MLAPLTEAAGPEPSDESRVARWLAGMSTIVLLIACANVANLMLARGARRRRETNVRLALGAGRRRLVGGAVAESVILALLGGALALALARWGGGLVRSTLLPGVSFPDAAINRYVLLFTAGASVLAGLPPALAAARHDVGRGMASDSRGNSAARSRVRSVLTVTQAALSVVLLVGAGLFVRSLGELRSLDLGLDTDRLLVADFEFVEFDPDPSVRAEAYERAMQRVAALPEVESVAATASPFGMSRALGLRVPGLDSIPRLSGGGPYIFSVTPGYFETAGLTITAGRAIDERDGPDATPVVVVSETMARALWPGEDPMGRCVLVGSDQARCTSVVGVVEDAARNGYRDRPYMAYYLSMPQVDALQLERALGAPSGIYVRSHGPASDAESAVTASLRAMPPQVRWVRVQTLQERLDPQARSWTLGATMFSVFGLLALALAAVGLYSVLAFDVAQRTCELGIRSALGAERARLLRSVLYQGGRLAVLGVAVGLAVAYVAAPRVQDLLFQVSPRDPRVLGAVALTLLAVSLAASLIPGLRATRVDPVAALRAD